MPGVVAPRHRYVCADGVERNAPPPGYVCHRCGNAGHWKQDCPMGAGPNDAAAGMMGLPGPGYVCKICQVPGHWIRDCPQKKQQEDRPPTHPKHTPFTDTHTHTHTTLRKQKAIN